MKKRVLRNKREPDPSPEYKERKVGDALETHNDPDESKAKSPENTEIGPINMQFSFLESDTDESEVENAPNSDDLEFSEPEDEVKNIFLQKKMVILFCTMSFIWKKYFIFFKYKINSYFLGAADRYF